MRVLVAIAAAIGWFALVLQYVLLVRRSLPIDLLTRTINYFSFFTILSNIMAALTLTFAAFPLTSAPARFFTRPSVRAGVAAYMTITALVYFFLLRHLRSLEGWALVADRTLHDIMPVLFVGFWLLAATTGTLRVKNALVWLIFPAAFTIYSLIRGAYTGRYPYPFLDVAKLGYPQTFTNIAMLLAAFAVLALILIALDRVIGRRRTG
ncbi:MAG TPA: Pr6Pr family membrane protein [Xanthobacteraceae bacterium]|jgi:hypothetical protein